MTLPRLHAFIRTWSKTPPLHESAAAIAIGLGALKPRDEAKHNTVDEESPEAQAELAKLLFDMPISARRYPQ
jgi:hypothetical protein